MSATPSVHEALQEAGQPHVYLTFDSVMGGKKELPFIVGVLGDFSGGGLADLKPIGQRRFVPVSLEQFDTVMSKMMAELDIAVPNELANQPDEYLGVTLRFRKMDDFTPQAIVRQVPELAAIMNARRDLEELKNWGERLSKLRELDDRLTRQLRTILRHEKFLALEATWRGLSFLLNANASRSDIEYRIFSCSKTELLQDFERASEIEASMLYKQVFEEELGSAGGLPYSLLIGDFEFDNSSDDVGLLSAIAYVASTSQCPFITSPSTELFGVEDWNHLPTVRGLTQTFSGSNYIKWNSFRESDDARYVAFVLPRVLGRELYGSQKERNEELDFQEVEFESNGVAGEIPHQTLCWINGAYLLASKIVEAQVETGFCSRFIGPESGGMVKGLPAIKWLGANGEVETAFGAAANLAGSHIAELSELGTIPIVNIPRLKCSAFFSGDAALKPKTFARRDANESAAAFGWLPYVMTASRIAHYLLAIIHDRLGSSGSSKQTQETLETWLRAHCVPSDSGDASPENWPLQQATLSVQEIPRETRYFLVTLRFVPWPSGRAVHEPLSISIPVPRGR